MLDTTLLDDDMTPSVDTLTNKQITEINLEKISFTDHLDNFRYGRHTLIALAIFAVVSIVLGLIANPYDVSSQAIIIEGLILCAIYCACALLISRKPLLALFLGVGIYLCVIALSALVDPETIISGLIIKIAIFTGFYKGISGYLSAKKSADKLRAMGVPKDEVDQAMRKIKSIPRTPRHEAPSVGN